MKHLRAALLLLVIGFTFLTGAIPVFGHAQLESSNPPADSLLSVPPRELSLVFTEPIDLTAVTITAVDERGVTLLLGSPRLDPASDRRLLVPTDDFSLGAYTISWSNRSATDGHTLSGSFAFRVGGTDRAPAAATVEGERPPAWAVLTRWLAFLGLAPAIGMLLVAALGHRREIVLIGAVVAAFATAIDPVLLASIPPAGSESSSLNDAIRAEPAGWWVRLIGTLIVLLICLTGRVWKERWRSPLGAAGLLALSGLALTSHGAGRSSFSWAAAGVTLLHNASVALWIGALILIAIAPARNRFAELGQLAKRALPLAAIAVLTGVISAGLIFPSLDTLTSTGYGKVLIAKVALVVAVLALAGWHHLSVRRNQNELPGLMRRTVPIELALAALVIALASTMAMLAPPAETRGEIDLLEMAAPTTRALTTDQLFVRLNIDPGQTGENTLTAYATQGPPLTVETDNTGAPLAVHHPPVQDVELIRLELTSLGLPIAPRTVEMTAMGDGRFSATGVNFSADGWWRVITTIRRTGVAEDLSAEFIIRTPDPNISGFDLAAASVNESSAEAEAIYISARDQLAVQPWAVYSEDLSGGNGGVELSTQVWSNGGIQIQTPAITLLRLDGKRYFLDRSDTWRTTEDSEPEGPAGSVAQLEGATDFVLGNQEQIGDRTAQVIHFYVPGTVLVPAFYTWWVDVESGQVLQEAMVSRSHYMIQRFDWSEEPEPLVAPVPLGVRS